MSRVLIYGSYGYTGKLIVERAIKEGLTVLLAGRDENKLRAQAKAFGLEYRVFSLDQTDLLDQAVQESDAVLHCAGPFSLTVHQMIAACLRNKKHYIDINGEIEGFEALASLDAEAKEAGIMVLPGAGFDVVPSDCLIAQVASQLPDATHVQLYIKSVGGGISRGTARSSIENMHRQGRVRRDGKIVSVKNAWDSKQVDFGKGPMRMISVGWGDVSTAYHSTGIPNITTYMSFPKTVVNLMRLSGIAAPLLYNRPAKNLLKWLTGIFIPGGPSREKNENGFCLMIADVQSATETIRGKLRCPEGYKLTALTSVEIVKRILQGDHKIGFQTPSTAYGADFILQFEGVELERVVQ